MDINSNDSYEEEFDTSDMTGKQSIFPSRNQIIIGLLFSIILIIILEKLFIKIFLFFIPSYIWLFIFSIIIHLVILKYLIFTIIYPGKNLLVNFYLRNVFGKIRAKSFNYSLFANALMLVGSIPSIATSSMVFNDGASTTVNVDAEKVLQITTTPFNSTDTITFSLGAGEDTYATITKVDNRHVKVEGEVAITGLSDVPAYVTITATNGTASATIKVTVTASA